MKSPAKGSSSGYAPLHTTADFAEDGEGGLPYGGWEDAGRLSKWVYHWVTPILKRGSEQQLSVEDVPPIPQKLRMDELVQLMKKNCAAKGVFEPDDEKKTLLRNVFVPMFFEEYFKAWAFNVLQQSCELSSPIVLRWFVTWHGSDEPLSTGVAWSFLMFSLAVISSMSMAQGGVKNYISGLKMRGSMMAMIFEKSTRFVYFFSRVNREFS
jgi:hypothetical protein